MKKPYPFSALSDKVCDAPGCRARLKKNLVDKSPNAKYCYYHHMLYVRKHPDYVSGKILKKSITVKPKKDGKTGKDTSTNKV